MKRDMELIRKVLLQVEGEQVDLSEYSEEQILYHQALAIEADLVEGKIHYSKKRPDNGIPDMVHLTKPTWKGHDLIDVVRDNDRWSKVKKWVNDQGKMLNILTIFEAIKALFL